MIQNKEKINIKTLFSKEKSDHLKKSDNNETTMTTVKPGDESSISNRIPRTTRFNKNQYEKYFSKVTKNVTNNNIDNIDKIIKRIENKNIFNKNIGVIISSTTIYGEKTYNIEGPSLKCAFVYIKKVLWKR